VVEETLQAERAHVLELAAKLGETEQRLEQADVQRKALKQALTESSQWIPRGKVEDNNNNKG
jgi:hypothetical protein